jgi:DNA repair protein RadC
MTRSPSKREYRLKGLPIKSWAEADRPREKLKTKGKQQLSEAELMAILLGSGTQEESALALSKRMLSFFNNDLTAVGRADLHDLKKFKGIGEVKAIKIIAALELGRRRQLTSIIEKPQVCSSKEAFDALAPLMIDLPHEEFWIIMLNRANRIIGREKISSGGVAGTVVDAKVVFRKAIQQLACSLILAHNHPSGNLRPSQSDIDLTKKLMRAGQALDITVLDHLIITHKGFFSFADEGVI